MRLHIRKQKPEVRRLEIALLVAELESMQHDNRERRQDNRMTRKALQLARKRKTDNYIT